MATARGPPRAGGPAVLGGAAEHLAQQQHLMTLDPRDVLTLEVPHELRVGENALVEPVHGQFQRVDSAHDLVQAADPGGLGGLGGLGRHRRGPPHVVTAGARAGTPTRAGSRRWTPLMTTGGYTKRTESHIDGQPQGKAPQTVRRPRPASPPARRRRRAVAPGRVRSCRGGDPRGEVEEHAGRVALGDGVQRGGAHAVVGRDADDVHGLDRRSRPATRRARPARRRRPWHPRSPEYAAACSPLVNQASTAEVSTAGWLSRTGGADDAVPRPGVHVVRVVGEVRAGVDVPVAGADDGDVVAAMGVANAR